MEHINPLHPLEFRVIKLDHHAVLTLLRKILIKISIEQLRAYGDNSCIDSISVGQYFDDNNSEVLLFAYVRNENIKEEVIIPYVKNLAMVAQNSILANDEGWQHCDSIQLPSEAPGQTQEKLERVHVQSVKMTRFWPWPRQEVRIIRLTEVAIGELLWEYFMEVGYQLMNLPQEDPDDLPTIYRMYTEENYQSLTLYVMNLFEASDSVFRKIDAYCDSHINTIGEAALADWTEKSYYMVGSLANL